MKDIVIKINLEAINDKLQEICKNLKELDILIKQIND